MTAQNVMLTANNDCPKCNVDS